MQIIVPKINNKFEFRDFILNLSSNGSTDGKNEHFKVLSASPVAINIGTKQKPCAKLSKNRSKSCCKNTILSFYLPRLNTRALATPVLKKKISVILFPDYTLAKTFEARNPGIKTV